MATKSNPGDDRTAAIAAVDDSFCRWYPLACADAQVPRHGEGSAPEGLPGVFQIRVRTGLLAYPRGKSAMIHYGHGADLGTAVRAFAARHPERDWLCRHLPCATAAAAAAFHAQILDRFTVRFGTPPRLPRTEQEAARNR